MAQVDAQSASDRFDRHTCFTAIACSSGEGRPSLSIGDVVMFQSANRLWLPISGAVVARRGDQAQVDLQDGTRCTLARAAPDHPFPSGVTIAGSHGEEWQVVERAKPDVATDGGSAAVGSPVEHRG